MSRLAMSFSEFFKRFPGIHGKVNLIIYCGLTLQLCFFALIESCSREFAPNTCMLATPVTFAVLAYFDNFDPRIAFSKCLCMAMNH